MSLGIKQPGLGCDQRDQQFALLFLPVGSREILINIPAMGSGTDLDTGVTLENSFVCLLLTSLKKKVSSQKTFSPKKIAVERSLQISIHDMVNCWPEILGL